MAAVWFSITIPCADDVSLCRQSRVSRIIRRGRASHAVRHCPFFAHQIRAPHHTQQSHGVAMQRTAPHPTADRWKYVSDFTVLGRLLSDNACCKADWEQAEAAMWRAFFTNCVPNLARFKKAVTPDVIDAKLRLLQRCVLPIVKSRWGDGRKITH